MLRTVVQGRRFKLKAKLESSLSYYSFSALNYRCFQHGFHRFNLQRLTMYSLLPLRLIMLSRHRTMPGWFIPSCQQGH